MNLLKQTSANALIEFALVIPILVLLLAGILNYGVALQQAGVVAASARAGAESALIQTCTPNLGCYTNTAQMQAVAAASASSAMVLNYQAVATNFCTCSPGSGVTTTCGTFCPGYGVAAMYAQVSVTGKIPLLFGHVASLPVSAVARVRISCPNC